jgi:hypothetical protein
LKTLEDRLRPFFGKRCALGLTPTLRQKLISLEIESDAGRLPLHVFDWKRVPADLKEEICEAAGQDDYVIFAVLNPSPEAEDLEEMVSAENDGYLMYAADRPATIYVGFGEMEKLATADELLSALALAPGEDDDDRD